MLRIPSTKPGFSIAPIYFGNLLGTAGWGSEILENQPVEYIYLEHTICIPYAEDIIIEADEAWAIPMSVCEGIFCCGEATSQTQGVIPRKWAWAIVVWHHHNHKHNSNNNSNSNCDNNTTNKNSDNDNSYKKHITIIYVYVYKWLYVCVYIILYYTILYYNVISYYIILYYA